jgi:hypothetical protein
MSTMTRKTRIERYNSNVIQISGQQEKILRELAQYKFLTVSQLDRLGVGYKKRIYDNLKKLVDKGLIKHADYKSLLRYGKQLERIHYLTPKAAKLLVENTPNLHYDNIRYPKSSTTIFTHDYLHRVSSVNTQIAINEWLHANDFTLIYYDTYFDVVGSRKKEDTEPMRTVTRIDFGNGYFLDPDGIVVFEKAAKTKIFLIEVYNGKDTKRVLEQLRKHVYVVKHGLAASKYNIKTTAKVISTFENESNMKAVMERCKIDPYFQFEGIENYFFFGLAEIANEDFEHGFINLKGDCVLMSSM